MLVDSVGAKRKCHQPCRNDSREKAQKPALQTLKESKVRNGKLQTYINPISFSF